MRILSMPLPLKNRPSQETVPHKFNAFVHLVGIMLRGCLTISGTHGEKMKKATASDILRVF
jgi:hypothetical protein